MARSLKDIDFEQYYEDWRHRDTLTWQLPAITVAIGGGIMIGSFVADIPWFVKALAFGLGAFFIATLTVMLAQNLYYQWRDEKHLEDYKKRGINKLQSKPIPPITEEEKREKSYYKKIGRIIGSQRMGSTLLLFTCFSFYVSLSYMFSSTWQWYHLFHLISGIFILGVTFLITFGWFFIWLKRI